MIVCIRFTIKMKQTTRIACMRFIYIKYEQKTKIVDLILTLKTQPRYFA